MLIAATIIVAVLFVTGRRIYLDDQADLTKED
jgi:hypothetical protein